MREIVMCGLAVLLTVFTALCAAAQGAHSSALDGVQLSPWIRVGYQRVGANFSLEIPFIEPGFAHFLHQNSLDLDLPDAGLWVGEVGLELKLGSTASLYASAKANAKRTITVHTKSEAAALLIDFAPVTWSGTRVEWWQVDAGARYAIANDMAIVGGVRMDHLSLGLADPRDPNGILSFFHSFFGDRYSGDFRAKLTIPYLGLSFGFPNFSATLAGSPIAFANVRVPLRYLFPDDPDWVDVADYRFRGTGYSVWGRAEYDVHLTDRLRMSLWASFSATRLRGVGTEATYTDVLFPFDPLPSFFADGRAHYTVRMMGLGVSGELSF